jgi:response regulator RpfG family c-di-GMP phosphodiesterase
MAVLTNNKKNAEFTLQRCKMLVEIGLVPLHFYQYGSDDSGEVGAQQDSTRRNLTDTLTYTTSSVTQSLEAITMNMTQCVALMSSKMAKDNTTGNKTQSLTATANNVAHSLAATTRTVTVDDYDRKPEAVLFQAIATARNVIQLLEATAGNKTQSPAATASNVAQSLSATTSDVDVDNDDRKPEAVLFETISTNCNVTQLLESTAGNNTQSPAATASNVTQSLAATTSDIAVDDDDRKLAAVLFEAIATYRNVTQLLKSNAGNKTQSLAATSSNVAHSLAATTSDVAVENDDRKT